MAEARIERRASVLRRGIRFSFAFRPVEDWFHPSVARLRRAGLCATQFSRLSFAFSPRSKHVPPSLARLESAWWLSLHESAAAAFARPL